VGHSTITMTMRPPRRRAPPSDPRRHPRGRERSRRSGRARDRHAGRAFRHRPWQQRGNRAALAQQNL